jgi:hypothetical protein
VPETTNPANSLSAKELWLLAYVFLIILRESLDTLCPMDVH